MALTYRAQGGTALGTPSGTTVTFSQTGVVAGAAISVWVKHEDLAVTITVSDGTTSFTADTKISHSNGDLHGQWFYLPVSVASGSVTYTATFGAAVPYRTIMVWEHTYSGGTLTFDASNRAEGTSTASFVTGNITTTGTDEVVLVGYGEYSSVTISATVTNINGVAADHQPQFTGPNYTASWDRVVTGTFTGQGTTTLSSATVWLGSIMALKVTAGGTANSYYYRANQ